MDATIPTISIPGGSAIPLASGTETLLVIDTIGSNGKTWLDTAEHPSSESLHVVERFDRPDFQHLNYEVTIGEAQMYTKPWKNSRVFALMRPGMEILGYSCEENNKELFGERAESRAASKHK
jgi:hypothetical protein